MGYKRKPEKAEPPKPFKKPKLVKPTYDVEPRPDWHAVTSDSADASQPRLPHTHEEAVRLLQEENDIYQQQQSGSSHKFLTTIMASGTSEDKISALTLLVQEAPLHNMKALDNLIGLSKKRSRDQALMALAALKDLFGQGAVLPERKLKAFNKQSQPMNSSTAILAAFEDWLKKKYFELIQLLEERCNDEVAYARSRAVTYVWELLKDKPEQEENLLRLVVHKLGDRDGKIASRAGYLLLQLQNAHPAMKPVIITSIAEHVLRPRSEQYYGVITLNQTVLVNGKDEDLANKLLETYFALFVQLLKRPDDQDLRAPAKPERQQGGGGKAGKMAAKKAAKRAAEQLPDENAKQGKEKLLSQVLTGVNRAMPFADASQNFNEQLELLYQVTHSANFNTAVQALMLLQRITGSSERFYRTLYEALLDPRLITSSKQTMFLNTLYKSLKIADIKRVRAFAKRLLQITNVHEPPFICSVIFLVYELIKQFPSLGRMISDTEEADDETEQTYDPRKRDPVHAHAETTALWDVLPLLKHFHPSVPTLIESLSLGDSRPMVKPDPATHTLLHFLDKFMYRTPKTKTTHGSSIMQPSAGSEAADLLVKPSSGASYAQFKVNNESFWEKRVGDVAPEDVFFHSYFNKNAKARKTKQKKAANTADEDDSDAGEDEIWQAIAHSRPDVEGIGSDEDDDLSIGDLESAYSDSDDEDDGGIDLGGEGTDLAGDDEELAEGSDLSADDLMPELDSDEGGEDDDDREIAIDLEESGIIPQATSKTGKDRKEKKMKLKQLPIFATADDYAKLLADEPDDV